MRSPRLPRPQGPVWIGLVLAALVGCADASGPTPGFVPGDLPAGAPDSWTTPDEPVACLPITPHCLGPMPSNLLTRADPSTVTGLRVHLIEENFAEGVFAQAARALPPSLLNHADGFSPAGPIVIPLAARPDAGSLPADLAASVAESSPILLVDAPRGERVPFRVRLDPEGLRHAPPQYVLVLTPARPLRTATPHIVLLRSGLRGPDGAPLPPYPGFAKLRDGTARSDPRLAPLQRSFDGLLRFVEHRLGIDREEVILAFDFTTRSEASLMDPLLHLRREVLRATDADPPRARIQVVLPGLLEPSEACEVLGSYTSPSFRTEEDKTVVFDEDGLPVLQGTNDLDFILKLPRNPAGRRAPVVIFGHGLWVFKETVLQVSEDFLRAGFAVATVDAACHGSRIPEDGFIADLFRLETVQRAVSCLTQTIADELVLVRLLREDLSHLDLLPYDDGDAPGDGRPDLDAERIYYVGQSMGTVIGLTFVALSESIPAAVLNVPGAGIVSIVTNGELTAPMVGWPFVPAGTAPLDRQLLYVAGQMFLDYIDPIHFAARMGRQASEAAGAAPQILLQESLHDGFIPNWVTEGLARTLRIPLVAPYASRPFGLEVAESPVQGSGLFQYAFTPVPAVAHGLLVVVPESRTQMVEYIRSAYAGGEGEIIDPYSTHGIMP